MSIKKCRECGGEVSSSAKQCPHCGKPQPTSNPVTQLFFAGVVGVLIAVWWSSPDPALDTDTAAPAVEETPKTPAQLAAERRRSKGLAARHYCREVITRSLHDPDSADWEPGYKWPVSVNGNQVTVEASLRANNAFGGKVFNTYTCVVDMQGNSGRVISLE